MRTEMRWRVRESRISEMITVWWMAFCMLSYHMLLPLTDLRMSLPASRSMDSLLPAQTCMQRMRLDNGSMNSSASNNNDCALDFYSDAAIF